MSIDRFQVRWDHGTSGLLVKFNHGKRASIMCIVKQIVIVVVYIHIEIQWHYLKVVNKAE